jgi:hypothetical protein
MEKEEQGSVKPNEQISSETDVSAAVSSQDGDVSAGPQDAGLTEKNAELQTALQKMERDMSRLRSTYDRQMTEQERTYKNQLSEADRRIDDVLMAQMNDQDRLAYEIKRWEERYTEMQDRLAKAESRASEVEQIAGYRQFFDQLGISDKVDFSDMSTVGETAFPAILQAFQELKEKAETSPQQTTQTQQQTGKQATRVVHQHGQQPTSPKTVPALLKKLSDDLGYNVTEDDIGKLIQRGLLDESIFADLDPNMMY